MRGGRTCRFDCISLKEVLLYLSINIAPVNVFSVDLPCHFVLLENLNHKFLILANMK